MHNQWKMFENITKDRNYDLFWDPKWPKNWASEAHILHISKSTSNEHVKQYWYETSENFQRKWPKTEILTYFGAPKDPKIEPLWPILSLWFNALLMSPMTSAGYKLSQNLKLPYLHQYFSCSVNQQKLKILEMFMAILLTLTPRRFHHDKYITTWLHVLFRMDINVYWESVW